MDIVVGGVCKEIPSVCALLNPEMGVSLKLLEKPVSLDLCGHNATQHGTRRARSKRMGGRKEEFMEQRKGRKGRIEGSCEVGEEFEFGGRDVARRISEVEGQLGKFQRHNTFACYVGRHPCRAPASQPRAYSWRHERLLASGTRGEPRQKFSSVGDSS